MRSVSSSHFQDRRRLVLEARARRFRSALNFPEQLLWKAVAGGRLGVHFRRQVVLADRYIVDMLAPAIRLVVEVDGRCHELRRRADMRRDETLRRLGYRVLRIPAELVLRDLAQAVALVREAVEGSKR